MNNQDNTPKYDKVNWLHSEKIGGDGIECAISASSGLIEVKIPGMGRRVTRFYADEFQMLRNNMLAVAEYIESHIENTRTSYDAKEARKLKPTLDKANDLAAKTAILRAEMVSKLVMSGASDEQIERTLKLAGFGKVA